MNTFDVVINLHNQFTRKEESLDAYQVERPQVTTDGADRIPIVGLDFVQCFLQDLRVIDILTFICVG